MKKILMLVFMMSSSFVLAGFTMPSHESWNQQKYREKKEQEAREAREAKQREWEANEAERQRRIRHNEEGKARQEQSLERKRLEAWEAYERMEKYENLACCYTELAFTCKDNGAINVLVKAHQQKCITDQMYFDLYRLKEIPICDPVTHEYLGRCPTKEALPKKITVGEKEETIPTFDESCNIRAHIRGLKTPPK